MTIPATRIDDKIQATRFKAWVGLVISIEPGYCEITDPDIPQVDLSPVIDFDLSIRRVCEDVDVAWDMTNSYSPFDTLVGPPPAGTTWHIDWGDGNTSSGNNIATASGNYGAAAGEWDLAGAASAVFDITITLTDDSGLQTIITIQIEVVDCTAFPFMGYAGLGGDGPYIATTWFSIAGDLSGDWLNVNDISVMDLPGGVTEVWVATDAGLAVTRDNGGSWRMPAIGNPPNDWDDAPSPTMADARVISISHNPNRANQVFALVSWQNAAGKYRGAYLRSFDFGYTWIWESLGGNDDTAGTWIYPKFVLAETWCWSDTPIIPGGSHQPPDDWELTNPENALSDDGNYGGGRVYWDNRETNQTSNNAEFLFVLDLGCYITLNPATVDGGINVKATTGNCTDTLNFIPCFQEMGLVAMLLDMDTGQLVGGSPGCPLNSVGDLLIWTCAMDGYPPDYLTKSAAVTVLTYFRYVVGYASNWHASYFGSGIVEMLIDYIKLYPHAIESEVVPLGLAVNPGGGYLYITYHQAGSLRLRRYDINDDDWECEYTGERSLGTATQADVAARTYWAMPYVPVVHSQDVADQIYIYGRMNAPAGLVGTKHLIRSTDRGVNWTDIGDSASWGANCIGGFLVEPSTALKMYVFLNTAQQLWITLDGGSAWTNRAAIPFDTEAVDFHPDYCGELIIGNLGAAANPVQYSMDDGLSWFVTSAGLPGAPAGGVNALKLLTEWVQ
jgi:hypothetical protein